jgi:SAM-dependent methyltransferase
MALPFARSQFDAVVCQFGVMFFPDRIDAYLEARRMLKPGGRFIFNTWDRIEENEIPMVISDAVAAMFPDDPPAFLRRTPHGYHDVSAVRADLEAAGFSSIELRTVARRSVAPSPRDAVLGLCAGTPLRNEIEARDPNRLDEAVTAATAAVGAGFGPGEVEGEIQAHVIVAS